MSFAEQERALLDLLFDTVLRESFTRHREQMLAAYELTAPERADFATVRSDALGLDASMRVDLILQHMCRALPVSFSITSSLPGGLDLLRSLVDTVYIRTPSEQRAARLGQRLRAWLTSVPFASDLEQAASVAVCDAELSMTRTAAALRQVALSESLAPEAMQRAEGWEESPLALAPYVSVAVLPQAYTAIKRALCPVADGELWSRLCVWPLPAPRRAQTLAHESPRLLVARAYASEVARCEATIDHRVLELSAGFAPLLAHLDGQSSLTELLRELTRAGATERVSQSVRAGFGELYSQGMITVA